MGNINLLAPIIRANIQDGTSIFVGTRSGRIKPDEMVAMAVVNVATKGNMVPWFTNNSNQLQQMDLVFGAGKLNYGSHIDHNTKEFKRPNSELKFCSSGAIWLQVGEYIGKNLYGLDHKSAILFHKMLDNELFRWVDAVEQGKIKYDSEDSSFNVPHIAYIVNAFDYSDTYNQKEQNKKRKECLEFLTKWMNELFRNTADRVMKINRVVEIASSQEGPVLVLEDSSLPLTRAFLEYPDKFSKFKVAIIKVNYTGNSWIIQGIPRNTRNTKNVKCPANERWRKYRKKAGTEPIYLSEGVELTFVADSGYKGALSTDNDKRIPIEAAMNWIKSSEKKPCLNNLV